MKPFLLLAAAALAYGQVDVINQSKNSYIDLARNAQWGRSGPTGMYNAFLFFPVAPIESVCVWINNNNPTSSHTFSFTIATTTDQTLRSFLQRMDRWIISPDFQGTITIPARGTWQQLVTIHGAAIVSINLVNIQGTEPGTPDTGDLLIGQYSILDSMGGTPPCVARNAANSGGGTWQTGHGPIQPFACTQHYTAIYYNSLSGFRGQVVPAPPSGQSLRICNVFLSFQFAGTGESVGQSFRLQEEPNGCTLEESPPGLKTAQEFVNLTTAALDWGPQAALWLQPGNALCVFLYGGYLVNVAVNASYDFFP